MERDELDHGAARERDLCVRYLRAAARRFSMEIMQDSSNELATAHRRGCMDALFDAADAIEKGATELLLAVDNGIMFASRGKVTDGE